MTVRGNKGDKTYQVLLDCKAGTITYNGPQIVMSGITSSVKLIATNQVFEATYQAPVYPSKSNSLGYLYNYIYHLIRSSR